MHEPSRKRRKPSTADQPVDERRHFLGRRRFELARDVQLIFDFQGLLRDVNPALQRVLGYNHAEIAGTPVSDYIHPEDLPRTLEEARRLAQGGPDTIAFENRFRTKGGDWVWFEWAAHASPVEGLIYASARNITARKTRELALERAAH